MEKKCEDNKHYMQNITHTHMQLWAISCQCQSTYQHDLGGQRKLAQPEKTHVGMLLASETAD